MKTRVLLMAWVATTIALCLHAGLWSRSLEADNRLYFFIAERAASGVPPHVSAPDVKNQLSALVDGASIAVGRRVGLDDVHAGRLAALAVLAAGVCGVGLLVLELEGSAVAATVAAISTMSFGGLVDHAAIGFNPKILLFALIAWTHVFVLRGRWRSAGAAAAGAMLCWQPAVAVVLGALVAAIARVPRGRRILRVMLGASIAVALYEAYFAWHGVLEAQLFQACLLPLGSAAHPVDVADGLHFITSSTGEHFRIPAYAFAIFVVERIVWLSRRNRPGAASAANEVAVVIALLVGGLLCVAFTIYDHQGEPDRFLLSAYFCVAIGLVGARVLELVGRLAGATQVLRVEGALVAFLLMFAMHGAREPGPGQSTLEEQLVRGRILRLYAEAYGSVWGFGCSHLLGLAHLTNYHPLDYLWDDVDAWYDTSDFTPAVGGRLPDVIVAGRRLPGHDLIARHYVAVHVPELAAERVRLYVRRGERVPGPEIRERSQGRRGRQAGRAGKGRHDPSKAETLHRGF